MPAWAWHKKQFEVQQYLGGRVDGIDRFIWPLLRDNLEVCHCLFSRSEVSITPILPPVDLLPTFESCPRRIYMSATIADDSEIIRTFEASQEAIANPITSESLAGTGERMILVPELMNLSGTPVLSMIKNIAAAIAKQNRGVATLSPSRSAAKEWVDIAEHPETTDDVLQKVAAMQAGHTFGPLVLANRYDGIDLASRRLPLPRDG